MYAHTEIGLNTHGIDFTVQAEGSVCSGGSNSHGSDEPAWTEVEDITLTHTDGRAVSKRTADLIHKEHSDTLAEALIESLY